MVPPASSKIFLLDPLLDNAPSVIPYDQVMGNEGGKDVFGLLVEGVPLSADSLFAGGQFERLVVQAGG